MSGTAREECDLPPAVPLDTGVSKSSSVVAVANIQAPISVPHASSSIEFAMNRPPRRLPSRTQASRRCLASCAENLSLFPGDLATWHPKKKRSRLDEVLSPVVVEVLHDHSHMSKIGASQPDEARLREGSASLSYLERE